MAELPTEIVLLILQRLRLPELEPALLVCKTWNALVVKEFLHPCLKFSNLTYESECTHGLINGEWYVFPMRFFLDARNMVGYRKQYRQLQSVTTITHKCHIYFVIVYPKSYRSWTMVLSCNFWASPVVRHFAIDDSCPIGDSLWPCSVKLWLDDSDESCSSYKVILCFFQPCYVVVFDSRENCWKNLIVTNMRSHFAYTMVQGDVWYGLDMWGMKLASYSIRNGGAVEDVTTFHPRLCSPILTEFGGHLLVSYRRSFSRVTLALLKEEDNLKEIGEIVASDKFADCGMKAVKDKVYYFSRDDIKVWEWSLQNLGVTSWSVIEEALGLIKEEGNLKEIGEIVAADKFADCGMKAVKDKVYYFTRDGLVWEWSLQVTKEIQIPCPSRLSYRTALFW